MRNAVAFFAVLACCGVQAMPLGLRTAMWGVAGANRRGAADTAFPALDGEATAEDVAAALDGATDGALAANITDAGEYAVFREWARRTGSAAVKASDAAWLSYALGADTLVGKEIASNDVYVASFDFEDGGAALSFVVGIDGVNIGGGSVAEETLKANLKKVLGLEGAASLDESAFSPDGMEIVFETPKDGKARFSAIPPKGANDAFFMRVKVKK